MNTPVSFELAKLIKEKGFDEPTSKYFRYDGKECENKPLNWNEDVGFFSRPSIAEVVMWLYERREIWISISCDCGNDNLFYSKIFSTEIGIERCIWTIRGKNSPTEAYEAAIEYTLKNLI